MKCALPDSPEYKYVQQHYGRDIARVALERNNAYALHLAPNGKPSRFFADLQKLTGGNHVRAEVMKILSYGKLFNKKFGDRTKGEYRLELDENGEPLANDVIAYMSDMQRAHLAPVGNAKEKVATILNKIAVPLGFNWEWAEELAEDNVAGIIFGNEMRFNPNLATLDVPFHEVIHPLIDLIRVRNPKLWEELKKNVPQAEVELVRALYPDLKTEDDVYDEAVTTYAGTLAAYIYDGYDVSTPERQWYQKILDWFAQLLHDIFGVPIETRSISHKPFIEVYDMLMSPETIRRLPLSSEGQLEDYLLRTKKMDANSKWLGTEEELDIARDFATNRNIKFKINRTEKGTYIFTEGDWALKFNQEIAANQNNDSYQKGQDDPDTYTSNNNSTPLTAVGKVLRLFHPQEEKRRVSDAEYKEINAIQIADRIWKDQAKTTPMVVDHTGRQMTYEQAVEHFKASANEVTLSGRMVHKIVEMGFLQLAGETKHAAAIASARQQAIQLSMEAGINFSKMYKNVTSPYTNSDGSFNPKLFLKHMGMVGTDDFLSEQVIVNAELGMGGTADIILLHNDGSVTIADVKSTQIHNKESGLPLRFSDNLLLNNSDMNDLQVMLYAIMYKANNPDAQFRGLKVLYNNGAGSLVPSAVSITKVLPAIKEMLIAEGKQSFVEAHPELFRPDTYRTSMLELDAEFEGMDEEKAYFHIRKKIAKLVDPKGRYKGNIDDLAAESNNPEVIRLAEQLLAIKAGLDRARQVSFDKKENKDMTAIFRWVGHINRAGSNILSALASVFNRAFSDYNMEMFQIMVKHDELLKRVINEIDGSFISKVGGIVATNPAKYTGWMWVQEGNIMRFVKESDPEFKKQVNSDAKRAYYAFYKENLLKTSKEILSNPMTDSSISRKLNAYYSAVKRNEIYTIYLKPTPQEAVFNTEIMREATRKGEYKNLWNKFLDGFTQPDTEKDVEYRVPLKGLTPTSEPHTLDTELIFKQHMANLMWKKHMDPTIELFNMARSALPRDAGGNFVSPRNAKFLSDFTETQLMKKKSNMAGTWKVKIKMLDSNGNVIKVKRLIAVPELILDFLRTWTNYAIMPLRPVLFVRNLLMEQTFNTINAAAGSYASIAGGREEDMFTMTDLAKAHQIQAQAVFNPDIGKKIKNIEQKYKFGVDFTYEFDNESRLLNQSWFRERALFATSRVGEEYSARTAWIAAMINDGMWDKYDKDGNYIGEERFSIRTVRGLEKVTGYTYHEANRIREIISRVHGTYSKERASYIESYAGGRLILQFKKYLINFGFKIFSSTYNSEAMGQYVKSPADYNGEAVFEWEGQIEEGAVQTILRLGALVSSHGLNIFFNPKLQKQLGLTQMQMHNLAEVTVNLATILLSNVAANMIFDPDEDDNNQKNLLYREANKLLGDLAGIYSIQEWGKSAQTPSVALKRLIDIVDALFMLGDTYKTSSDIYGYTKGEDKGLRRLKNLALPFSSGWKEALTVWAIAVDPEDVAKRYRPSEIAFAWEVDTRSAADR